MARYTGPDCKLCRREKTKLFLKGAKCDSPKCPIEIRPYPPGEHGRNRPKEGDYLQQIREKQKARRIYGILERQFHGYYEEAARKHGRTGETMLQLLERRLDNVVFRAGFAKSRDMARQLVTHGHFTVNGRKVDIPSYRVSENDIVEVTAKAREQTPFIVAQAEIGERHGASLARGGPRPHADPGALTARPGPDRHAGPGTAHRRVLLEVNFRRASTARRKFPPSGACPGQGGRRGDGIPPTWGFRGVSPRKTNTTSYSGRRGKELSMLIAQRPSLSEEQVDEFRSRFVIEPLEPGFGYTIGNSLRRTLLSSIPGAAVTSIRIEGVLHEFSTVPGVKEDVTDIILNLKELVVSSEHDEPVVMYLRKQGPGEVTAADIAPPAGVEVHNPELHVATLNAKGRLEMELTVERGRGYVSATQNKQPGQEIGRVPIDSIYSPVLRVTYKVEATRVEQRTDFDRLILDVETKPCMRPRDAVASAGKTLVELFGLARELNVDAEGIDIGPSPTDAALAADLALPIEDLNLTVRSYNCLKREGIHTVGELVGRSEQDLLDIRNFGAKSIEEVKQKLIDMGLSLKDSPPGFDPSTAVGAYSDDDESYVETEQY